MDSAVRVIASDLRVLEERVLPSDNEERGKGLIERARRIELQLERLALVIGVRRRIAQLGAAIRWRDATAIA